jgi:hypothetical protein
VSPFDELAICGFYSPLAANASLVWLASQPSHLRVERGRSSNKSNTLRSQARIANDRYSTISVIRSTRILSGEIHALVYLSDLGQLYAALIAGLIRLTFLKGIQICLFYPCLLSPIPSLADAFRCRSLPSQIPASMHIRSHTLSSTQSMESRRILRL